MPNCKVYLATFVVAAIVSLPTGAQDTQPADSQPPSQTDSAQQGPSQEKNPEQPPGQEMPGMDMGGARSHGISMRQPQSLIDAIVQHASSGTSSEPNSAPHDMIMVMQNGWMIMFHGEGFFSSTQQSGPRGADKIFSTNWAMPMAQREVGPGALTLRTMLSLEPATVSRREYPELFQLGETAYGRPIVDGQHPHDFFMELAALYDVKIGSNTLLSIYAAPVGDPAMGPTAYPHRTSASEDPVSPLGHHLEDSTHIADSVLTAGLTYKNARLEFSGFHGREPDEYRWDIDSGRVDSWSTRLTVNPSPNWSAQYSIGRLKSPEQLNPREDVLRMTASLMYNRTLGRGNWASTLIWGRNRTLPEGEVFNGYLAESTLKFKSRNYIWGRLEDVDRTNELLLGKQPVPPGFQEHFLARVQVYTLGYDREFEIIPHLATALGGQVSLYGIHHSLVSVYGSQPKGVVLFLRVRPVGTH